MEAARCLAVHAHVERPFPAERESAAGVVEVVKRHSQIGQNSVYGIHAVVTQEIAQKTEIAAHCREGGVAGEIVVGCRALYGVAVLVETEQTPALRRVERPQDRARMAATAESAVHIDTPGPDVERLQRLGQQSRNVIGHGHSTLRGGCDRSFRSVFGWFD